MSACPFCGLGDGFHDEDVHAAIPIPADKRLPTHTATRTERSSVCANSKCAQPFTSAGAGGCRNPRHQAA